MLAEWQILPDDGQRLVYRRGTLAPAGGPGDVSGFAQIARLAHWHQFGEALSPLFVALRFIVLAIFVWRWAAGDGVYKFSARHLLGTAVGLAAILCAAQSLIHVDGAFQSVNTAVPVGLTFLAPVQQSGSALNVEVANVPVAEPGASPLGKVWPALLALVAWGFAWSREKQGSKAAFVILGWTLLVDRADGCPTARRRSWPWPGCFCCCTSWFRR